MIGIDLIRTARMEAMIKRFGERGLRRFLGTEEIALIHHYRTAAGFWAHLHLQHSRKSAAPGSGAAPAVPP